jgi:hypothetical protein
MQSIIVIFLIKGLLKESDREANLEVNGAATTFCLK